MGKEWQDTLLGTKSEIDAHLRKRNKELGWPEPSRPVDEIPTADLAKFGSRERHLLVDLLTAWNEQGLPYDFWDEDVVPMFNQNSGFVFLTNSEFQVALLNGEVLESWYTCPECGVEGFEGDGKCIEHVEED